MKPISMNKISLLMKISGANASSWVEYYFVYIARYYGKFECGLANREGVINEYALSCDVSIFRWRLIWSTSHFLGHFWHLITWRYSFKHKMESFKMKYKIECFTILFNYLFYLSFFGVDRFIFYKFYLFYRTDY